MKPNRNRARDLGFYVLLIVIMMAVIFTMTGEKDTNKIKNYSDLVDLFTEEKVQSFRTEGSTIILEVRTGDAIAPTEEMKYDLYSFGVFYEDFKDIIKTQYESGVLEEYDYDEGFVAPWWASMIPYVLVMVGVMALFARIVSRLFDTHYSIACHAVIGIVLASTLIIIPTGFASTAEMVWGVACAILGAVLAYFGSKLQPQEDAEIEAK